MIESREWMSDAACRDVDTNIFYVGVEGTKAERAIAEQALDLANLICAACEVRSECLEYALAHQEMGVWSGTTDRERKRIRSERRRLERSARLNERVGLC